MRHSAAQRRLDEPSKARRVLSLALALQTKGVRSREHRFARMPRHRRERERWSAPEILHEVPNVSDDRLEADERRRRSGCFVRLFAAPLLRCKWVHGVVHRPSRKRRRKPAYLYPRDDSVFVPNVRIQVQVPILIELLLLVKLLPHHILDGQSNSPTAKSFKVWRVAGQAHVSAGDLEDEARVGDADESEEEGESAGSSNGKAVDAEMELADGVWRTPAAKGEDEASRRSFAEDDDDGSSDDREVTPKRAFQAYERSHRIDPNLLVHEHAPVVLLLADLDLGHPYVEPPHVAAAWIAPGEANIVFRSTFQRAVRRGHPSASTGAGDGAGTTTSFGTAGQSLGSGSGGRAGAWGVLKLVNCLEDVHGLLDRLGASVNERVAPEGLNPRV
ncbi:hypothetical protein EDB85DRAFT_2155811 [Lactarius pseudohatsudake]|nr:hypothetical protein EDB85DRAFT_2155811 [Lactarius pseudohatsudake]